MSQTFDSVADVITRRFSIPRDRVQADATFDDLGLDSLSQIELVTALQKQLGVHIADEELDGLADVNDVVELVERKVAV